MGNRVNEVIGGMVRAQARLHLATTEAAHDWSGKGKDCVSCVSECDESRIPEHDCNAQDPHDGCAGCAEVYRIKV